MPDNVALEQQVERLREALMKAKQAARYIAVGDGYYDPYANHVEAVDAVVDAALGSSVSPEKPLATVSAANDEGVARIAEALAADTASELMFLRGDNKAGWEQLARTALATSSPQYDGAGR
jgi:NAD(P)H-hydrate repair Nnr-like enzyme with NAD(P)H-hydrate epimerase domain